MKKILLIILISFLFMSIVSANDNITTDNNDTITLNETTNNIQKTQTNISASNIIGYENFKTTFKVKLTSNNTALQNKTVNIMVNNVNYIKKTNNSGIAILNIKLTKGTYIVKFSYSGDNYTSQTNGLSKITIKKATKTTLSVVDKDINYRQGLKSIFQVKLQTSNKNIIKNQEIKIKVDDKTYIAKTNSKGIATIYLNLKKGLHKVKYSFTKYQPYLSSSGYFKIKSKSPITRGDGYWVLSNHMKKINLKKLSKKGTKQIFLHVHSIAVHGKMQVIDFIKKAKKYHIKVHLWMQVFYSNGKWVRPVNKDSSLKYSFMNKKIKEAKRYAKIKGISGIHFDYIRFGGTAHLYKTSTKAINYFTKKASLSLHKIKPNLIVSAAIMPEPSSMKYYYGQDIPTMSKYLDVLLPMVYKGNYHQKTSWIKSVTKSFKKQSNSALIWTGLQSYKSDSNAIKLSQKSLIKDSKAAINGGASGIILFRFGISCNFNFKKL